MPSKALVEDRQDLTTGLRNDPYSLLLYLERAWVSSQLDYPDLAVTDTYKALLLADEVLDIDGEYHHQAHASLASILQDAAARGRLQRMPQRFGIVDSDGAGIFRTVSSKAFSGQLKICQELVRDFVLPHASLYLAYCLADVGCLRSAYGYVQNVLRARPNSTAAEVERQRIFAFARQQAEFAEDSKAITPPADSLPDRGLVRREVYPWNEHEQNRVTPETLSILNDQMQDVAPKLAVKLVDLPLLGSVVSSHQETCKQLGVFAHDDIEPGEHILLERSLLTANAKLHEPLCDACSRPLPDETTMNGHVAGKSTSVACPECDDVVYCSQRCLELAQHSYHSSICGNDIDAIAKDVPSGEAVDALYVQLMFRALAMAITQDVNPLELREVKYIWGDFTNASATGDTSTLPTNGAASTTQVKTLPFDFRSQVLQPLHFLELLDINIFEAPHDLAETWVYNTLLAKFRGTASARVNPHDGRPEVAAVHPLWCLANHSCDPNVEWEWAGEISFTAREKRVSWQHRAENGMLRKRVPERPGGIRKNQEILNHYVDIDLGVKDRREWGAGALGGHCRCPRCQFEAGETQDQALQP